MADPNVGLTVVNGVACVLAALFFLYAAYEESDDD